TCTPWATREPSITSLEPVGRPGLDSGYPAPNMKRALLVLAVLVAFGVIFFLTFSPSRPARVIAEVDARDAGPTTRRLDAVAPKAVAPVAEPVKRGAPDGGGAAAHGGTVAIKGAWGSGSGQFARRHDPESN